MRLVQDVSREAGAPVGKGNIPHTAVVLALPCWGQGPSPGAQLTGCALGVWHLLPGSRAEFLL